jgi:hypothetical protein
MAELEPSLHSAIYDLAVQKALRDAEDHGRPPPSEPELAEIGAEAERKNVYGFDYKKDRHGNPIPQGIGSPNHETTNHFSSIRRYQGEAKYQAAVRKMWKENPERARKIGLEQPERASA